MVLHGVCVPLLRRSHELGEHRLTRVDACYRVPSPRASWVVIEFGHTRSCPIYTSRTALGGISRMRCRCVLLLGAQRGRRASRDRVEGG